MAKMAANVPLFWHEYIDNIDAWCYNLYVSLEVCVHELSRKIPITEQGSDLVDFFISTL